MSQPAACSTPSRRDLAGPALRTFFNLAKVWGLNAEQERILLGRSACSTCLRWKSGAIGEVSHDLLERISYLLGIYEALHLLLPNDGQADGWVRRANQAPPFNGASALERMLCGQVVDLFVIRQYLDRVASRTIIWSLLEQGRPQESSAAVGGCRQRPRVQPSPPGFGSARGVQVRCGAEPSL